MSETVGEVCRTSRVPPSKESEKYVAPTPLSPRRGNWLPSRNIEANNACGTDMNSVMVGYMRLFTVETLRIEKIGHLHTSQHSVHKNYPPWNLNITFPNPFPTLWPKYLASQRTGVKVGLIRTRQATHSANSLPDISQVFQLSFLVCKDDTRNKLSRK